jgi:hypothetical protein
MNKTIKRVTTTSTWAASTDMTPVDLPREGLVTEITFRADITVTLTAAAYSDYFRRVLQSIKLEGDGGKSFLGMSGAMSGLQMGTLLSLWGELRHNMPTISSNGAGIALASPDVGSASFVVGWKFHPGSNPRDPFDLSAAIPARAMSSFQAKLTTAAAAICDSGANITAGTFRYEVAQVLGLPVWGPSYQNGKEISRGLMVPVGSTYAYSHTANYSDFGYEIDIPSGAFLRSIVMMVKDDTATVSRRKDDEITAIRLRKPKTGEVVFEQNVYELKQMMASRHGWRGTNGDVGPLGAIADLGPRPNSLQNMTPAGFYVIDLRQFYDPVYGLDLREYQTGDYKLGLTIENYASGDGTVIYWDQLIPVDPQYIGK